MHFLPLVTLAVTVVLLGGLRFVGGSPQRQESPGATFRRSAANSTTTKLVMSVVVSLFALAAALFVILSASYDLDSQKWAYATCGTVVGYWLHRG